MQASTHPWGRLLLANSILLALNLVLLVFSAFVPESFRVEFTKLLLTGIFLTSIYVIGSYSPRLISAVLLLVALQWLARAVAWDRLAFATAALNSLYILYLVVRMVMQFASSRRVTAHTLLIAVNGYLLIGLIYAIYAMLVTRFFPESFYVPLEDDFLSGSTALHTFVYYAFINMSTVGFGDIIPVTEAGRALAILLAVTGPLYIATVIAFLVGKFTSNFSSVQSDNASAPALDSQ